MMNLFNRAKKVKYVKIFGLPRSGTNYIAKLLEINFKTRVLLHVGQGKHNDPKILTLEDIRKVRKFDQEGLRNEEEIREIIRYMKNQSIYYLMIMKSPVNWMVSYRNYLRKHPNPKLPYVFHIDDSEDDFIDAVNWWNQYANNCINLEKSQSRTVKIVIYEDLLKNFKEVLMQIEAQFSLKRIHSEFINFDKTMLPGFHSSNEYFNAKKKMNDANLESLTEKQNFLLSENIDTGVMQYLNLSLPGC